MESDFGLLRWLKSRFSTTRYKLLLRQLRCVAGSFRITKCVRTTARRYIDLFVRLATQLSLRSMT